MHHFRRAAVLPIHFISGDLHKFAEQYGDSVQWIESNRVHIITHGVSGIEWAYSLFRCQSTFYDVYKNYWNDVCFVL